MKAKMPVGVRILFILLSIGLAIVAFFVVSIFGSLVTYIVVAAIAFTFAMMAIFIPVIARRKVMVFPLVVGLLLSVVPVTTGVVLGVIGKKVEDDQKNKPDPNLLPATYTYTPHIVSAPNTGVVNRAEYQASIETLMPAYTAEANPYRSAELDSIPYHLEEKYKGSDWQTGRFTEEYNPNYGLDIQVIKLKQSKPTYQQLPRQYIFAITDQLDELGLTDYDVLENLPYSSGTTYNVYSYEDFSFAFEYISDFYFDGISLRVNQYLYFNNFGYPEREEIFWSATCNDVYHSQYKDQIVYVYQYRQKSSNNDD